MEGSRTFYNNFIMPFYAIPRAQYRINGRDRIDGKDRFDGKDRIDGA